MNKTQFIKAVALLLLLGSLLLGGCNNLFPFNQMPDPSNPSPKQINEVRVIYNYNGTDKVQLSANNIILKTGQRLILQPAPGLTKTTRFVSSGENFFGDVMKQEGDAQASGKAVFTAIKPGKGKLQIIPNTDEVERAVDLWVTVE